MSTKHRWFRVLAVAAALSLLTLAGCGDDDADTTTTEAPTTTAAPTTTTTEATAAEVDVMSESITAALAEWSPVIAPDALFENLSDGDESNDPFIVSVRSPEHYALGHIAGAVNIPWKSIADDASLAMLPMDQPIVVYCYTGHTGQVAATILRALGYDVQNLKFGMMGWSDNPEVVATTPFAAAAGYPTVTEATALPAADGLPEIATGRSEAFGIIQARAQAMLADWSPVIAPDAVFENLSDGDDANDPLIVSVRSAEHYALGHIDGAVDIGWKSIATLDSLEALPEGAPIVTYCYTGHTGQVAATILALFGYDVQNMKWGMMGWSDDADVVATTPFSAAAGYPTEGTALAFDEADVVGEAMTAALADWSPVISAEALFENLSDGDEDNDPVIVSVRAPEHYALGHIQGAINVPWGTLTDPAGLDVALAGLDAIPGDMQIVVYCYTGHTGQAAATFLRMLGYDAVNLKWGMMGWSDDAEVVATTPFAASAGYPTETEANDLPEADGLPAFSTGQAEVRDILIAQAKAMLPGWAPVIPPNALFENLSDGDDANDPLIVSVRSAEDYALGHVDGAINIGWKSIATDEALDALPEGAPIVVYCYTGHTGQVAATVLRLMGYDVQNVKFGMMGWSDDPDVVATTPFTAPAGYPTVASEG
ncbi:MAG: hypothetical protein KQH83_09715 [Actinobacteria bacterium]|nr:hypothetical protein [Actinomycetota bacterium]